MEQQISSKRIPRTDSIQELAEFWEAHGLEDFADELEEVREPVFERGTAVNNPPVAG